MSASTLTSTDISARVRAMLMIGLPVPMVARADHNIALCIPGGCERLGRSVKESSDRALLSATLTNKAPTAGVLDLSIAAYANFFIDTFRRQGAISSYASSVTVFSHVADINQLRASTPADPDYVWYHLLDKAHLVFKNPADGRLNTYTTPLNLTGSYFPVLGDATLVMPGELDDQLVSRVAEMVKQLGGLNFLQKDPESAAAVVGAMPQAQ